MSRLSTFKPIILAGVALALAARAQSLVGAPSPASGWLLYAAAAVLFVAALRRVTASHFAVAGSEELAFKGVVQPQLFSGRIIGAVLATVAAFLLFARDATALLAWDLHLLSLVLFVTAFISFGSLPRLSSLHIGTIARSLMGSLPILAILALATFARLWQLHTFPFGYWYDEAQNGLAALKILADPHFRPVYFDSTNAPSHLNYLIALSFSIFGATPFAQRLVAALFGILAVLFAYLLFRRWFGPWMGVFAAGVLAVMRYHLTFSRFGLQVISAPAFELAVLYFLDRALARRKPSDFAWLGLSLGLGLAFYTAFRLFPLALAIFLLFLFAGVAVRFGMREAFSRYVAGLWRHWIVALLAVLIAVAPVAEFALRDPRMFLSRTNTVSIFQKRDQPDLGKALWSNTIKHLEMFNVRGDGNGRHNLPGAPMLDPIMGVLFVLGVAYALWRWRDPANALMLIVFAIMLLAGILSLDFEAPQSLRSIGVIPSLVYFITLPIAAVAQAARPLLQRQTPPPLLHINSRIWNVRLPIGAFVLLVLVGTLAYLNLHTFFVTQQDDPGAWAAYSTPETISANEMRQNSASHDFILTAVYYDGPIVDFLAQGVTNIQRWTATDRLPAIQTDPTRGLIMLFDQTMLPAYVEAQQAYPNAQFKEWHAPAGGGTVLYEVILSAAQLRDLQGVQVSYYAGSTVQGLPAKQEFLSQATVDWTEAQPLPPPFVAELRSTLHIQEYGNYQFSVRGDPAATLWLDGNRIGAEAVTLARGNHLLRLVLAGGAPSAQLLWQPPKAPQIQPIPPTNLFRPSMPNSGLLGAYYPTPDWSGAPAFTQVDPAIAFYFHIVPLPQPFSVEWIGKVFAPADGSYDFALRSVDGSSLMIDGQPVVDNPNGHATVDGRITLANGWHDITIRFQDRTGGTQIYLYWTPPGATQPELLPSRFLSPPMGKLPASP